MNTLLEVLAKQSPETDREVLQQTQRFGVHMVKADFCRKIERELTQTKDRLREVNYWFQHMEQKLHFFLGVLEFQKGPEHSDTVKLRSFLKEIERVRKNEFYTYGD